MKNSHVLIISFFVSVILGYLLLFIYTFFNFNNEFKYTFRSLEILNFHEKYSKIIHHVREEYTLDSLFKKSKVEDLLFTTINDPKDKKKVILFQGDSWMEQLTVGVSEQKNFISLNLIQKYGNKKKIAFINGGTTSHSPTLMNLQLDVLEKDFQILPNIVIAYINQEDIGDEICRYKKNRVYKDGVLYSINPETVFMGTGWYNYSQIYGLSRINLNNNSKSKKTFQLINFKFRYGLSKSSKRIYKKITLYFNSEKEKLKKCYWNEMEKYLIESNEADIKYFTKTIEEYIDKINQKKHIQKLILVTFPYRKHFEITSDRKSHYEVNVSDIVDKVIKNYKNVDHINFSKILLNNKNFNHENIWMKDGVHLKANEHAHLFVQKILNELNKYLF